MKPWLRSNWTLFLGAVALGAALVAGLCWRDMQQRRQAEADALKLHPLVPGLAISEQLRPDALGRVSRAGYQDLIDMRPDGEADDEPPSADMAHAARRNALRFSYIPVPHGDIPDRAVDELRHALEAKKGPVLLYCRSGRRAARTWSLAEASRPGGLDADAILAAVRAAGQSADDLRAAIDRRIRQRGGAATR